MFLLSSYIVYMYVLISPCLTSTSHINKSKDGNLHFQVVYFSLVLSELLRPTQNRQRAEHRFVFQPCDFTVHQDLQNWQKRLESVSQFVSQIDKYQLRGRVSSCRTSQTTWRSSSSEPASLVSPPLYISAMPASG